jgi:hypothetical protein
MDFEGRENFCILWGNRKNFLGKRHLFLAFKNGQGCDP